MFSPSPIHGYLDFNKALSTFPDGAPAQVIVFLVHWF